ncbi:hypothetical protein C8J56DRAFT_1048529 [Mycena floridula]|nr:hypothetical protein C8J56DRAFT_1048529 [Mycena floridula]
MSFQQPSSTVSTSQGPSLGAAGDIFSFSDYSQLPNATTFVDNLSLTLNLTTEQSSDLHTIRMLGAKMDAGELLIHIGTAGQLAQLHNAMLVLQAQDTDMTSFIAQINALTGDRWSFPSHKRSELRSAVKQVAADPANSAYLQMDTMVMAKLKKSAAVLGLTEAFKDAGRVEVTTKVVKDTCTAVRNELRNLLRALSHGEDAELPLDKAMQKFNRLLSLSPSKVTDAHTVRFAILCRFAHANAAMLNVAELASGDHVAAQESTYTAERPPKRTRDGIAISMVVTPKGIEKKIPFWKAFDTFIKAKISEWGTDLGNPQWSTYIKECLESEQRSSGTAALATPAFSHPILSTISVTGASMQQPTPPHESISVPAFSTSSPSLQRPSSPVSARFLHQPSTPMVLNHGTHLIILQSNSTWLDVFMS